MCAIPTTGGGNIAGDNNGEFDDATVDAGACTHVVKARPAGRNMRKQRKDKNRREASPHSAECREAGPVKQSHCPIRALSTAYALPVPCSRCQTHPRIRSGSVMRKESLCHASACGRFSDLFVPSDVRVGRCVRNVSSLCSVSPSKIHWTRFPLKPDESGNFGVRAGGSELAKPLSWEQNRLGAFGP